MIIRGTSASSIWNHKYDFRPKLHDTKFNYHFIASILPAIWYVTLNKVWNLFGCAVLVFLFHWLGKKPVSIFCSKSHRVRFRAENGAIWEQITLLRANQIARIAIDFKMDDTNRKTSKYQTECQCSVIHNNVQENKNNLKCIIVYIFVIVGRKWLLLWMSLLHHFNNYNTGNGV